MESKKMDIKQIVGSETLISEEEKVSHHITSDKKAGATIFMLTKLDSVVETFDFYEKARPLLDQLEVDIQGQGLLLNAYGKHLVQKTLTEVVSFFKLHPEIKCEAVVLMGSVEKWDADFDTPAVKSKDTAYVLTLNICKLEKVIGDHFMVNDLETVTILTVPLTSCGFMERIGAHITAVEFLSLMMQKHPGNGI